MLTAAPLSIAILGQVQLVAGQRDFSLTEKPPAEGFKYIKYPESFRASLVHLSNEGYNAFLQAHTNMDQIRLSTGIIHNKSINQSINPSINQSIWQIEKYIYKTW